jgi:hypothetical protein
MSRSSPVSEQKLLRSVKQRYTRRGYNVLLEPRGEDLPHFLAPFRPDMIAYNDEESVVVEVKSRADLPASKDMIDLANVISAQQGWRLDLVVVNPRTAPPLDSDAESLGQPEIVARLRAAHQLVRERQDEAAIMLAYAAVEATLRLVASQQRIPLADQEPSYMLKQLYSSGIVSREEYELLEHGQRMRNIISHGFRLPEAQPEIAEALIRVVETLLQARATGVAM